jgi:hypothetical protein
MKEMCAGPASRDRICSVVEAVAVRWFFTLTGVAVLCSVGQARHHRPDWRAVLYFTLQYHSEF